MNKRTDLKNKSSEYTEGYTQAVWDIMKIIRNSRTRNKVRWKHEIYKRVKGLVFKV